MPAALKGKAAAKIVDGRGASQPMIGVRMPSLRALGGNGPCYDGGHCEPHGRTASPQWCAQRSKHAGDALIG
jgi:hypothetical protein